MLSQTAVYALRAMGCLAAQKDPRPMLSREIAAETDIPLNFLSKILNRLVQADLVSSVRGRNGGFVLARPAAAIRMREVIEPFMRIDGNERCLLGRGDCDGACALHHRWTNIVNQYDHMLEETTVDKLA